MDLSVMDEVIETDDVKEANRLLADGWVLLAVVPWSIQGGDGDTAYIRYSLGFPGRDETEQS